jgi:ZIP family zinc transporter
MENYIIALLLSLIAGLSTTVGSIFAFIIRKPNPRLISFIMGFSAGVMILVSFVELLQTTIISNGLIVALFYFFIGMGLMLVIDMRISHYYEYEDYPEKEEFEKISPKNPSPQSVPIYNNKSKVHPRYQSKRQHRHQHKYQHKHQHKHRHEHHHQYKALKKSSMLIAIGIFIHNFPEGMATFVGTLKDVQLGVLLTVAVALHNIPEGIAVAVPVYASENNKKKAFFWSFVTGLSEPLGAIIVWLVLFPFINEFVINAMLAVVAGFMVYISLDELLPVSRSLGKEHISILGIITGMFAMSISLVIL